MGFLDPQILSLMKFLLTTSLLCLSISGPPPQQSEFLHPDFVAGLAEGLIGADLHTCDLGLNSFVALAGDVEEVKQVMDCEVAVNYSKFVTSIMPNFKSSQDIADHVEMNVELYHEEIAKEFLSTVQSVFDNDPRGSGHHFGVAFHRFFVGKFPDEHRKLKVGVHLDLLVAAALLEGLLIRKGSQAMGPCMMFLMPIMTDLQTSLQNLVVAHEQKSFDYVVKSMAEIGQASADITAARPHCGDFMGDTNRFLSAFQMEMEKMPFSIIKNIFDHRKGILQHLQDAFAQYRNHSDGADVALSIGQALRLLLVGKRADSLNIAQSTGIIV